MSELEAIERIADRQALADALLLLRHRAAGAGPGTKLGLDAIARSTQLPRSTLHTYLTGRSLPSRDALRRIAGVLDCSAAEQAALMRAWDRVSGGAADGVPLSTLVAPTLDAATAALLGPDPRVRTVAADDLMTLSTNGRTRRLTHRRTVQAQIDPALDLYGVEYPGPRVAADRIQIVSTDNCLIDRIDHSAMSSHLVYRIRFGQVLRAGDVSTFAFVFDFTDAYRPDVSLPPGSPEAADDQRYFYNTRHGLSSYSLRVAFHSDDPPTTVNRVSKVNALGPVLARTPTSTNRAGVAEHALRNAPPGAFGLEWAW